MDRTKYVINVIAAILAMILTIGCSKSGPPKYQQNFELARFLGTWHEVGRLPIGFERNCLATSFDFKPTKRFDLVDVNIYCWYRSLNGPMRKKDFKWRNTKDESAKFKVILTGRNIAQYWILFVDEDYSTALIGAPDRNHMWMLSRSFSPDSKKLERLIKEATGRGYDLSEAIFSPEVKKLDFDVAQYVKREGQMK